MNKLAKFIYEDVEGIVKKINFSELNNKTILITGATGLVGTYFVASLKSAETENIKLKVIVVAHNKPEGNFTELLPKKSEVLIGDLTNSDFLNSIPKADYIIHAAGYGQPGRFLEDQIKTLKLNTTSTFALFEKLNPSGKFLFVSTSEVYSGSNKIPYKEDDIGTTNTTHKRACYIEGKRSGEAITLAYRARGVEAKIVRLSLAYGPGTKKNDERVLNSFIQKGISGNITMLDAGLAKRTYCYITDAVEMMWNVLLFGKDQIYNVGGESKITIADLAKKIGKLLNVEVKIPTSNTAMSGAPEDVWLDLIKIKSEFKKKDFIDIDSGLAKTIEWQKMLYGEK